MKNYIQSSPYINMPSTIPKDNSNITYSSISRNKLENVANAYGIKYTQDELNLNDTHSNKKSQARKDMIHIQDQKTLDKVTDQISDNSQTVISKNAQLHQSVTSTKRVANIQNTINQEVDPELEEDNLSDKSENILYTQTQEDDHKEEVLDQEDADLAYLVETLVSQHSKNTDLIERNSKLVVECQKKAAQLQYVAHLLQI